MYKMAKLRSKFKYKVTKEKSNAPILGKYIHSKQIKLEKWL